MSLIDNALQTLFKLGIEVKKVWENASIGSSFAAQTINIGTADYDFLVITSVTNDGDVTNRERTDIVDKSNANAMISFPGFMQSSKESYRGAGASRKATIQRTNIARFIKTLFHRRERGWA